MAPRVLVLADVENWAWGRKAQNLKRWLTDFDITIWYTKHQGEPPHDFDLYHTFEFPQTNKIRYKCKMVTGITAHVWKTWGPVRVKQWCSKAVAIHANSRLLEKEMQPFHRRVYYTPNGVCPETFRRTRKRKATSLVVGHSGKPTARKGAHIIKEACELAGVELRLNQRRHADALSVDEMLEWYQDLHVIAVASDMDGTPNPALEGAACENAIISTRIGNMPEFIDNANGVLVDRSVDAMGTHIAWMKDHLPETVEMGRRARETVLAGWTWEKQVKHYRRMWNKVL